jgi:hypothetical protein
LVVDDGTIALGGGEENQEEFQESGQDPGQRFKKQFQVS